MEKPGCNKVCFPFCGIICDIWPVGLWGRTYFDKMQVECVDPFLPKKLSCQTQKNYVFCWYCCDQLFQKARAKCQQMRWWSFSIPFGDWGRNFWGFESTLFSAGCSVWVLISKATSAATSSKCQDSWAHSSRSGCLTKDCYWYWLQQDSQRVGSSIGVQAPPDDKVKGYWEPEISWSLNA